MKQSLDAIRDGALTFLRWWIAELTELLPAKLRTRLAEAQERLVLVPESDHYRLESEGRAGRHTLGEFDPGEAEKLRAAFAQHPSHSQLALELPDSDVLITEVSLPAAAHENLHQVLYYEMDRHTPFTGAKVQFGYRVIRERTAAGLLPVRLAVIPRHVLAGHLEAVQAMGLQPDRVQPAGEPTIDLTPAPDAEPRSWRPSVRTTMGGAMALLTLLLVAFPIWALDNTLGIVREEVDDLSGVAAEAGELRTQREQLQGQARQVAERRQRRPTVVAAIDEMSAILPDDTWIWSFRLSGDSVIVRGATPSASRLIGRIESSAMFRSAGFSAPITREDGSEQFQISTQLAALNETDG